MIRSMTGYGKGEGGSFVVEMRSVNHKFLDLSIKMPKELLPLENRIKKAVGERFSRGRLDVFINRASGEGNLRGLKLNAAAARQYHAALTELKDTLGLAGDVELALLASFKDVICEAEVQDDTELLWEELSPGLAACMDQMERMRAEEGATLASDIRDRAGIVAYNFDEITRKAPTVPQEYAEKLKERAAKLMAGAGIEAERLAQEVAIFAERADITEELVRARSHLAQLDKMLTEGGPLGRKMDFLIQEINREINTIGSKASDYEISLRVIEVKGELEKIREQVQNIE